MADPRRWDASNRAPRESQFVRPPAFRDEHESHLSAGGAAAWHGSGSRQVALAAILALAAGIAAVAFMLLVAPGGAGGEVGPQTPVGAEADAAPVDVGDVPVPASQSSSTSTTGLPLPGVPVP